MKNFTVIHVMYRGLFGVVIQVLTRCRFSVASFNNRRCHKAVLQKYDWRFIFRSLMRKTRVAMARNNSLRQILRKKPEEEADSKSKPFSSGTLDSGFMNHYTLVTVHGKIRHY